MYRAILPDGDIECSRYEQTDRGVELYTAADELIAFIPYQNLIALINEDVQTGGDRSIM